MGPQASGITSGAASASWAGPLRASGALRLGGPRSPRPGTGLHGGRMMKSVGNPAGIENPTESGLNSGRMNSWEFMTCVFLQWRSMAAQCMSATA